MTQTAQRHIPQTTAAHPSGPASSPSNAGQNPVPLHRAVLMINKLSGAKNLAGTLGNAGIDVVGESAAADDALGMAATFQPDTVLVHVGPDDNPQALLASAPVGLPLVVLADSADPTLVQYAVAAGAMGYVVAPFTSERLMPTLELAAARNAEVATLRATVTDISERLDTRKVVERAKGLLMTHQNLTEQDAFRFIQRTAMDRRSSMRDVANAITMRIAGAA